MTETYTGVVDRIVDNQTAVILLEADGNTIDELTLEVAKIPGEAAREGMIVDVDVADGEAVSIRANPEETEARRERNRERLERLGSKLSEREDR